MAIDAPREHHEEGDYRSYLLRLWRAKNEEKASWRASLRSVQTGQSLAFPSLEALFDYLRAEMDPDSRPCQE